METRVIKSSGLARRAKNNKIANTLNNLVAEYGCSVETDHNDNIVMRGAVENVEKALPLLETMNNYTEKGGVTLEDGTRYSMLGRVVRPKENVA